MILLLHDERNDSMRFVVYIFCCGFLCKGTDISALHGGTYISQTYFSHFGAVPPGGRKIPNFGPIKSEYLENGESQRYYYYYY